jgi:hypothetical protein
MILWILWIIAFFLIEGYAIKTNKYDTLSEKIWKVSKKHWVLRLSVIVVIIWAAIHLIGGECALGIC